MNGKIMPKELIIIAYISEALASIRYRIFSEKAEDEGFRGFSRLFRALSHSEYIHTKNHLMRVGGSRGIQKLVTFSEVFLGNTGENVESALRVEEFEYYEMYPAFIEVARVHGDKLAELSFRWTLEVEKVHVDLLRSAKDYIERGCDWPSSSFWICKYCGNIAINVKGIARCPVCGSAIDSYYEIS